MASQFSEALFRAEWDEHLSLAARVRDTLAEPFAALVAVCTRAIAQGGTLFFCGNGGSASDAQHLATELVCQYEREGQALPAMALTADGTLLTATANDLGYDQVFARQVMALARPGDVVIGLSTSGNSPSVLRALRAARARGAVPAGFSGRDGGAMTRLADPLLVVPSDRTSRIQEMHITLGHLLCGALEDALREEKAL